MKSAIITGATGGIGIALIKKLIAEDVEVLALCRRSSARLKYIPDDKRVTVKYCDLAELAQLENDTGKKYDVFYHLGWDGIVAATRNDFYRQNLNVKYSLDAVAAAKRFGCHTFIGAGSQAEYGRVEGCLKPDTPAFPENGYGITKLCAGQLTREYCRSLGLKQAWVRIVSVFSQYDGGTSMITSTVEKLLSGGIAEFTKAEQLWDFLFVEDAVEAFYALADKSVDGTTYVLGSGEARQLKEYINDIADCMNAHDRIKIGARPYADRQVMYLKADVTNLTEHTGWKPKLTFKDGVNKVIDFYKE